MQYAAFLRALNVGSHNRIKMDALRALCVDLGFERVETYLQTGNVLFDSSDGPEDVAVSLETALAEAAIRNSAAMVRTKSELKKVVAACPFDRYQGEGLRPFVTFYRQPIPAAVAAELRSLDGVVDVLGREVLTVTDLGRPQGASVTALVDRKLKPPGTARYWHVARALLERMD